MNGLLEKLVASVAYEFLRIKPLRFFSTVTVGAFLCCAMTAFALRTVKTNNGASESVSPPVMSLSTTETREVPPMQALVSNSAELLILTPNGFIPDAITRSTGSFLLVVENRCGLDQITLQLNSAAKTNLRTTESFIQRPESQDVFDLSPGVYVYTEAKNPQWTCTITITP